MLLIVVGILVTINHYENAGEESVEKMTKVKEGFILIKSNLGILKKIIKKVTRK